MRGTEIPPMRRGENGGRGQGAQAKVKGKERSIKKYIIIIYIKYIFLLYYIKTHIFSCKGGLRWSRALSPRGVGEDDASGHGSDKGFEFNTLWMGWVEESLSSPLDKL